jgi:hypothetical protein
MSKRLGAIALVVAAVAAATGLFASPSNSASNVCPRWWQWHPWMGGCLVTLTATGPSPSRMEMPAGSFLVFANSDSVSHTVVFADGRCSLTLTPGEGFDAWARVSPKWDCHDNSSFYVGSYAYTVDGKFSGTVVTTPVHRVVTLTARTHTIRGDTRLILHGQVNPPGWSYRVSDPPGWRDYVSVVVLARHNSKHPFRPIATLNPGLMKKELVGSYQRWRLTVHPGATTTYIAKVTSQLPQGQIWTNAKSRPFTVRIRS